MQFDCNQSKHILIAENERLDKVTIILILNL